MGRQISSDNAYGGAHGLARTAQLMRERGSGRQTDFTNYATRRLAERGRLREEDPIKLQHVVTEIAYARGSSSATGYVPSDRPLGPLRPPPEAMGWPDSTLREHYDDRARTADGSTLRQQIATNEAEIRARARLDSVRFPASPQPMTNPTAPRSARPKLGTGSTRVAPKSRRTPQHSARTTRVRCRPGRSAPTTAETERSGTPWTPTRVSPTAAHRPRSSRSANATSGKMACP